MYIRFPCIGADMEVDCRLRKLELETLSVDLTPLPLQTLPVPMVGSSGKGEEIACTIGTGGNSTQRNAGGSAVGGQTPVYWGDNVTRIGESRFDSAGGGKNRCTLSAAALEPTGTSLNASANLTTTAVASFSSPSSPRNHSRV